MKNLRGRIPTKIDSTTRNKMVTLRVDGELFNKLVDASHVHERSMNKLIIDYIEQGLDIDLKHTKHILKEIEQNDANTTTN